MTPLSQALIQGAAELSPSGGSLVLVSDGEATCEPDPCDTARSLREDYLATGSREEGRIAVTWMDREWVFDDETLVEIRPKNAVTVDGVTEGTPMSRVSELFGEPVRVDEDDSAAYFDTNKMAGVGLRITYSGAVDDGTVRTIVICRCIPQEGEADGDGAAEPSTMEEVCEAWWEVNRAFRQGSVVTDSDPTKFEVMVRFGEVASRSPHDAAQIEGSNFLEATEGGYVRIESYSSMQNIKAWCAGRPPR